MYSHTFNNESSYVEWALRDDLQNDQSVFYLDLNIDRDLFTYLPT